ncbi:MULTISPECIES: pirin family protein [Galbibacter]|uniref:Pirin family protein n=1 Tax=Galbibacter pacificus TaxID=2996052 RepID=A0ABT6FND5_9FLAO|nr:pirin family protein [Galbibacter pacificus]MDG3581247.1 pirin family protein [Galbibacter pacificus]MDG3584725.1 pirin family protein [Galbibacter pacificus]
MQSNVGLIIEEKAADIGNFMVGRLLPFRQKRAVGPFLFIDHMGPACLKEYQNLDVPPHPHIGLSTLTYLFDGAIFHRDSLGNSIEIKPGEVNWMTAGKGVVHSERTPEYLRGQDTYLHGFQIWIGLPKHLEQCEPSFFHIDKDAIPAWEDKGVAYKLIAGSIKDRESPVPVHSPMYFIEIKTKKPQTIDIGNRLFGEVGMYVLDGTVKIEGNDYGSKQLMIAKNASLCEFETNGQTTLYLFGGEPFQEERFMFWNFVNSDRSVLESAKENWKNQNLVAFPKIPDDDKEFVPLPEPKAIKSKR